MQDVEGAQGDEDRTRWRYTTYSKLVECLSVWETYPPICPCLPQPQQLVHSSITGYLLPSTLLSPLAIFIILSIVPLMMESKAFVALLAAVLICSIWKTIIHTSNQKGFFAKSTWQHKSHCLALIRSFVLFPPSALYSPTLVPCNSF